MGLLPPDIVTREFDYLENWQQACVIAYDQIREIEEMELITLSAGMR